MATAALAWGTSKLLASGSQQFPSGFSEVGPWDLLLRRILVKQSLVASQRPSSPDVRSKTSEGRGAHLACDAAAQRSRRPLGLRCLPQKLFLIHKVVCHVLVGGNIFSRFAKELCDLLCVRLSCVCPRVRPDRIAGVALLVMPLPSGMRLLVMHLPSGCLYQIRLLLALSSF